MDGREAKGLPASYFTLLFLYLLECVIKFLSPSIKVTHSSWEWMEGCKRKAICAQTFSLQPPMQGCNILCIREHFPPHYKCITFPLPLSLPHPLIYGLGQVTLSVREDQGEERVKVKERAKASIHHLDGAAASLLTKDEMRSQD